MCRKVPWSSTTDFGPSKAQEIDHNLHYSTTTSLRRPQGLHASFIQAAGPSVDFIVHFTPIWTCLAPKSTLELSKLVLDRQRQKTPAKTITTALPPHPDSPRAFTRYLPKRMGPVSFSYILHQFGPCSAPKSTTLDECQGSPKRSLPISEVFCVVLPYGLLPPTEGFLLLCTFRPNYNEKERPGRRSKCSCPGPPHPFLYSPAAEAEAASKTNSRTVLGSGNLTLPLYGGTQS